MEQVSTKPLIAVACGGTGGHLFPGLAAAEAFVAQGGRATLMVSDKPVDRRAVAGVQGMEKVMLPAVGLTRGRKLAFLLGLSRSFRLARSVFRRQRPAAVLAMGGFTSVPAALAARSLRVPFCLHESNTIPGRANRWLARWAAHVMVGFPGTRTQLRSSRLSVTGTPGRLHPDDLRSEPAWEALGLSPHQPLLLVMGGSQGANAINRAIVTALPSLADRLPELQIIHLSGEADLEWVSAAYASWGTRAQVFPFADRMREILRAASLVVSRAGASSLAEFAMSELPAILVPYPSAADDHQAHNAQAYAVKGAARILTQDCLATDALVSLIAECVHNQTVRTEMITALQTLQRPHAARDIAAVLWDLIGQPCPLNSDRTIEERVPTS